MFVHTNSLRTGLPFPILSDVEGSSFDGVSRFRTDSHRLHDRGMQVCDRNRVFNGDQRSFLGRLSV